MRVQLVHVGGCSLGHAICLLCLRAGCSGCLVGRIGRRLRLLDARLRPRIHILDVLGVLGVHFIQLAQPVIDGIGPLLYPGLAGKRIHVTPESFFVQIG